MERKQFETFEAASLYCPRCGRAMPVKKRLLIVLPEGEKYDYVCQGCGSPVGSKLERENRIIVPK